MSKDIWHEPTETPTEHKTLLFDSIEFDETEMGVYSGGLFHSYNEFEPMTPAGLSRWAYLSDFINCQKELIRTRKELEQSEICCTEWEKQALDYKAENIALSGDLERTRNALDVAVDTLKIAQDCCSDYSIECLASKP